MAPSDSPGPPPAMEEERRLHRLPLPLLPQAKLASRVHARGAHDASARLLRDVNKSEERAGVRWARGEALEPSEKTVGRWKTPGRRAAGLAALSVPLLQRGLGAHAGARAPAQPLA